MELKKRNETCITTLSNVDEDTTVATATATADDGMSSSYFLFFVFVV